MKAREKPIELATRYESLSIMVEVNYITGKS
jgi:hypothetical protein